MKITAATAIPVSQDGGTDWAGATVKMNANVPDPGNATNPPGDQPRKALLIGADGVWDIDGAQR